MQPHPRRSVDRALAAARAGIGLSEVLVVVALVGLLAGVTLPAYLHGSPSSEEAVRGAASRLAGVLETARYRAVALDRPIHVAFEPNGTEDFYTAYLDPEDPDGGPAADVVGTTREDAEGGVAATGIPFPDEAGGLRGKRLPEGVVFGLGAADSPADGYADGPDATIELPTNPVVFQPGGGVRWPTGLLAPAGGVYLRDAGNPALVNVVLIHPTGLIQNFRWSDGEWR